MSFLIAMLEQNIHKAQEGCAACNIVEHQNNSLSLMHVGAMNADDQQHISLEVGNNCAFEGRFATI